MQYDVRTCTVVVHTLTEVLSPHSARIVILGLLQHHVFPFYWKGGSQYPRVVYSGCTVMYAVCYIRCNPVFILQERLYVRNRYMLRLSFTTFLRRLARCTQYVVLSGVPGSV